MPGLNEYLDPGPLPLPPHPPAGQAADDVRQARVPAGGGTGLPRRLRRQPRPGHRPDGAHHRHRAETISRPGSSCCSARPRASTIDQQASRRRWPMSRVSFALADRDPADFTGTTTAAYFTDKPAGRAPAAQHPAGPGEGVRCWPVPTVWRESLATPCEAGGAGRLMKSNRGNPQPGPDNPPACRNRSTTAGRSWNVFFNVPGLTTWW